MSLKIDLENIVEGKNDATNFSAQLMRVVFKADFANKGKLRQVYPNLVETVERYQKAGEKLDLSYDEEFTFEHKEVKALIGAYLDSGIILLGDWKGCVHRSTDYAITWTNLGVIAPGGIKAINYHRSGIVTLVGEDGDSYRSTDYGATWKEE